MRNQMAKTVCPFKEKYQSKYIVTKSKQYYLPMEYIAGILADLEVSGFDILARSDRIFVDNYLATQAVAYHR